MCIKLQTIYIKIYIYEVNLRYNYDDSKTFINTFAQSDTFRFTAVIIQSHVKKIYNIKKTHKNCPL